MPASDDASSQHVCRPLAWWGAAGCAAPPPPPHPTTRNPPARLLESIGVSTATNPPSQSCVPFVELNNERRPRPPGMFSGACHAPSGFCARLASRMRGRGVWACAAVPACAAAPCRSLHARACACELRAVGPAAGGRDAARLHPALPAVQRGVPAASLRAPVTALRVLHHQHSACDSLCCALSPHAVLAALPFCMILRVCCLVRLVDAPPSC